MLTRIFKSGNSLAVRIPKELAFAPEVQEVEIDRIGGALVLRPAQPQRLAGLGDLLASFSPAFMSAGRDEHPEQERDWGAPEKPR